MAGRLRTVLHVDMDAFYVSVELRRRPELAGRPVVVGGTGRRGVVAAASYEARRFGVHSAMPSAHARRLCPHAVFLPGDHALYGEVSEQVHAIFARFTPHIEPIALDEAFLDVTGALALFGSGAEIGQSIRNAVRSELDLGCSVGVAANKFLAKLASEAAKPIARPEGVTAGRGVVVVAPGGELAFLHPLPVRALWGVGPATFERLSRLGIRTVGDLAAIDPAAVRASVGTAHGNHLIELAHAHDDRPVESHAQAKSIGHEETFATDLHEPAELRRELVRLADAVAGRLRAHGVGARTITLKVRFAGFRTITRSTSAQHPLDTGPEIVAVAGPLLDRIDPTPGVRLLGVSGSHLAEPSRQLTFDDARDVTPDWGEASAAIDAIRERFGARSIGPTSAVAGDGLRLVRRGAQQWGPDHDS
jgi:DNA polymerase-4